ncbi:hypothetical protein ACFQ0G_45485 [Streptomyces chiangmaiensis]
MVDRFIEENPGYEQLIDLAPWQLEPVWEVGVQQDGPRGFFAIWR